MLTYKEKGGGQVCWLAPGGRLERWRHVGALLPQQCVATSRENPEAMSYYPRVVQVISGFAPGMTSYCWHDGDFFLHSPTPCWLTKQQQELGGGELGRFLPWSELLKQARFLRLPSTTYKVTARKREKKGGWDGLLFKWVELAYLV